jgi:hypothetical protein
MRLAFAVLSIAILTAGCSSDSDSESAAIPGASIALEYSAKDPAAATAQAEKQCTTYGRTAKERPAVEGAKANVIIFDCQ